MVILLLDNQVDSYLVILLDNQLASPLDNPSGHPAGQLSGQPALYQGRQTGNLIGY